MLITKQKYEYQLALLIRWSFRVWVNIPLSRPVTWNNNMYIFCYINFELRMLFYLIMRFSVHWILMVSYYNPSVPQETLLMSSIVTECQESVIRPDNFDISALSREFRVWRQVKTIRYNSCHYFTAILDFTALRAQWRLKNIHSINAIG